jgi:hypothetical protein
MSALRLGRLPDGTRDIRIIDDGASARLHGSRMGIKGGYGNPIVGGSMAVGESSYARQRRAERECKARRGPYRGAAHRGEDVS